MGVLLYFLLRGFGFLGKTMLLCPKVSKYSRLKKTRHSGSTEAGF